MDWESKPTTTMRGGEICYGGRDSEGWVWYRPDRYEMDPHRHYDRLVYVREEKDEQDTE